MFKVDIPNKAVESARAGGDKRVSVIASVAEDNGVSMLQGADGAAGCSGTINQSSGLMTFVSSRKGVTYSVFGTCAGL